MATTRTRKSTARKANKSLPARTARTIRERPYVSAAIATGAVTAVAAAAAGAFFFRRSGKSWSEVGDDLSTRVKDGLDEAGKRAKGLRGRLGIDDTPTQAEIAEEALTLKETGRKVRRPVDDTITDQTKAGAVAY